MNAPNVLLALIGMVFQNLLMLGTGVVVARAIGAADYGAANLVRNILQFTLLLSPLGLDIALQKHVGMNPRVSRTRIDVNRLRLVVFGLACAVSLTIVFLIAPVLNARVYHVRNFVLCMAITFLALPAMTDINILGGVFRARLNPAPQVISNYYVQPIARLALLVVMLVAGFGLTGVLVANTFGALAGFALLNAYFLLRQDRGAPPIAPGERPAWRESLAVLRPALWMAFSVFFYSTIRNVDILVLGAARPMKEVGEYGSLSTIAQLVQFFPNALALTLGPTVARLFAENDIAGLKSAMDQYMRRASMLGAPLFGAAAAWGGVLDILFGRSFHFSPGVAAILALSYLVSGVLGPLGFGLSMTGRHRTETIILIVGNLFVGAACLLTSRPFGQLGVAASVLAGYGLINAFRYVTVRRALTIVPGRVRDVLPPILCLVAGYLVEGSAFALFPRHPLTLIGSGLAYGLVVMALYWILILAPEEKIWVRTTIAKILEQCRRLPVVRATAHWAPRLWSKPS